MLFNSVEFVVFFLTVFLAFHGLPKVPSLRVYFLIGVSLIFYASWDVRFLPVLVLTAGVDFAVARKIAADQQRKKLWLLLSISSNVILLLYFKAAFALGYLASVPLGVSFYTFQSMSYVIDVYRGVCPPALLRHYFAAVTFFPHLIAGPIVRAQSLMGQFASIKKLTWHDVREGLWLIACGASKKSLADWVGASVDAAFRLERLTWADAVVAGLGFVAQIYGDFSGYTDIARGCARLLGYELPLNFLSPFLARSPREYYAKHWHLSLASWVYDYLYFPLALFLGRRLRFGVPLALLTTMLVMGLWHGFGWNYLAWGAYVGVLLTGGQLVWERWPRLFSGALARLLTFHLVLCGLVIFRAETIGDATAVLAALHGATQDLGPLRDVLWCVGVCVLLHLHALLSERPMPKNPLVWYGLMVSLSTVAFSLGRSGTSFIYFQF